MPARSNFPTAQAIVLLGTNGIGKTSLGMQFDGTWCLHDKKEQGVHTLAKYNRIPKPQFAPSQFNDYGELMEHLLNPPDDIRSLLIDGLPGVQDVMVEYKVANDYSDDFDKFNDYKRGYDALARKEVNRMIDILQDKYIANDINVILLSQVALNKVENPYGPDYRQFGPTLDARFWQPFKDWADVVLFYFMEAKSRKENPMDKRKKEGKIAESDHVNPRVLHTEFNNHHEAKNRMGLPETIEGESAAEVYRNYREAVIRSYKGEA